MRTLYILLSLLAVFNITQCDITLLNSVRLFPQAMAEHFNLQFVCEVPIIDTPLLINDNLIIAARAKVTELLDTGCPFEHKTCDSYCYKYKTCAWQDRVFYYLDEPANRSISECIGRSSGSVLTAIKQYLESPTHCYLMMSPLYKIVGFHFNEPYNAIVYAEDPNFNASNRYASSVLFTHNKIQYFVCLFDDIDPTLPYQTKKTYENQLGHIYIYDISV